MDPLPTLAQFSATAFLLQVTTVQRPLIYLPFLSKHINQNISSSFVFPFEESLYKGNAVPKPSSVPSTEYMLGKHLQNSF